MCQAVEAEIEGYGIGEGKRQELQAELERAGRAQLASHVGEAANTALSRMKDRFSEAFTRDEKGLPRRWSPSENIGDLTQAARAQAAMLLAQLAILQLGQPGVRLCSLLGHPERCSVRHRYDIAQPSAGGSGRSDGGDADFSSTRRQECSGRRGRAGYDGGAGVARRGAGLGAAIARAVPAALAPILLRFQLYCTAGAGHTGMLCGEQLYNEEIWN